MNSQTNDFHLRITESTDCRIGIGESFWGGADFYGIQVRLEDGTVKNFPFFTILGGYVDGALNVIFSEEGVPVKTLSFSDLALFETFRKSPLLESVRKGVLNRIFTILADAESEFLPEIHADGRLTSRFVDRKVAHEEGIGHISTHYWAVNPDAFHEVGDIGIYMGRRSAEKSSSGKVHWQRLGGGHVGYSVDEMSSVTAPSIVGGPSSSLGFINPGLRRYVSVTSVLREIEEETGIRLMRTERVPVVSESWVVDFDSLIPEVPGLRCIEFNAPYGAVSKRKKWGKDVVENNNERVDVYAFEFFGEITGFDRREIEAVELIPSRKMLELLDNDPEMFWIGVDANWKSSRKYLMMRSTIENFRKYYGVE